MQKEYKKDALEFIRKNPVCHMATVEDNCPISRVMWTVKAEDDFSLWFVSRSSSQKMKQVEKNSNVCLTAYQGSQDVRVFGKAVLVSNSELKKNLWKEEWKTYFPQGSEDPEYQLIQVQPKTVEYRDAKKLGFETVQVL